MVAGPEPGGYYLPTTFNAMDASNPSTVTGLLHALNGGDAAALDRLLPLLYDELRRLAEAQLRRERPDHTLGTTGLVHEAYLRLVDQAGVTYASRNHFLSVAAMAMRRVLIDYARRRRAGKRDGGFPVTLDESLIAAADPIEEVLFVDLALARLAQLSPRQAKLVELRYFGGASLDEAAQVLEVSLATAKRDWVAARAWLLRELSTETRIDPAPPA